MRKRYATLFGLIAIGLVGTAQAEVLVTRDAAKVGDKPSTIAPYPLPQSRLADHAGMPKSHLEEGEPSGGLASSSGGSGFSLSTLNSDLRAETAGLLTELNATEQDDGSILVSLPGDVLFDFDKSDIRADAKPVLDQVVRVLNNYQSPNVEIIGHTDSKGSDAYNQALSEERASSVSAYLSAQGIAEASLSTIGKGESEPVAANETPDGQDDPEGRQANRRVEFVITPKSEN